MADSGPGKTVIVLGASGLIGGQCVRLLLTHPGVKRIIAPVRRELSFAHPKLETRRFDFERPDPSVFEGEALFSCLGTTIRKAGSREAFRRVDHDCVVETARLASERGVRKLLLVSSVGADPRSRAFYTRVKGEVERAIGTMRFQEAHLFRPSFLLGERAEKRPLEDLAFPLLARARGVLFRGPLRKYAPIEAERVARAMIAASDEEDPGIHAHEENGGGDSIGSLAARCKV